jgi:ABC-type uncharacterized transport system ATPase subunit
VAGDDQALWTSQLAGVAAVERIAGGTATLSLTSKDDAQVVLDMARSAGPVEQFGFERRRLSEVFRDAVGADVEDLDNAGQPGQSGQETTKAPEAAR